MSRQELRWAIGSMADWLPRLIAFGTPRWHVCLVCDRLAELIQAAELLELELDNQ